MSVIFVDIETTGLSPWSHIIQIAAKCGSREFNAYMLPGPGCPISAGATAVNGLRRHGNELYLHNRQVRTQHPKNVMNQFAAFVNKCHPSDCSVLVSHNASFDAPIILKMAACFGVHKDLFSSTVGYADSISVIRQSYGGLRSYALPFLVREFLSPNYNLHNALGDVRALSDLTDKLQIYDQNFFDDALQFSDYC